jgi:CheY-like chemotaxis protein
MCASELVREGTMETHSGIHAAPLILVVDDAEDSREAMGCWLTAQGFRVETAKDGFDGVRKASTLHPDLILMDLNMPGMDGVETTRFLKRQNSTSSIPVFAVTGQSLMDDRDRAKRKGFEAVFMKPVNPQALSEEIHERLG